MLANGWYCRYLSCVTYWWWFAKAVAFKSFRGDIRWQRIGAAFLLTEGSGLDLMTGT